MKLIIFSAIAILAVCSVSAKTTTEWGNVRDHKALDFDRVVMKGSKEHYQHVDITFPKVSFFSFNFIQPKQNIKCCSL